MSVTLPYFRDASLLPGPLPTDEEIEAATTTLPSIRDPKYGRIVLIRNKFVVKYGRTLIHVENEGGGPIEHQYFWTLDKDPAIVGPFKTENDLNLALAKHSRQNWEENARYPWLADFYERNLHRALKDHESVFTHADLQRKNILVEKRIDTVSGEEHYVVSALVDWQTAGWYPSYWEYAGTFCCLQWVDDWPESLEKILDPCPLEAAMLRFVHQDLEF
ncbi:hypothetical protein LOZ47_005199 [Ophidiomyces ophidiicola]|nr:hypothetical protein LOZ47_005199 [Ophidiomyces ophidiicola]